MDATAAGSELQVLDSGSYGPTLNITKSITISAEGVTATLFNPTATATITINNVSANVVLRGLTLSGGGEGLRGIEIIEAAVLHIERCEIERFTTHGIRLQFADTNLFIKDTVGRANGTDGLLVNGSGTTARVSVENSRFENNGDDGLDFASGTIEAAVADSFATGNAVNGFAAGGAAGAGILVRIHFEKCTTAQNTMSGFTSFATASMTIERSEARGNGASGMATGGTGLMVVSNSVAPNNGTGFTSAGGLFRSRQNNTVSGNTVNVVGVITPLSGT